jgi:DNA-binding XRE family transcriptional regulator
MAQAMTKPTSAAELRAARKAAGLSQESLARALGMSLSSVVRWESGRREIPLSRVLAIKARLMPPVIPGGRRFEENDASSFAWWAAWLSR